MFLYSPWGRVLAAALHKEVTNWNPVVFEKCIPITRRVVSTCTKECFSFKSSFIYISIVLLSRPFSDKNDKFHFYFIILGRQEKTLTTYPCAMVSVSAVRVFVYLIFSVSLCVCWIMYKPFFLLCNSLGQNILLLLIIIMFHVKEQYFFSFCAISNSLPPCCLGFVLKVQWTSKKQAWI